MRPIVYKNVKELTYGELLRAISNIKENMNNVSDTTLSDYDSEYYKMLVEELDNRQKEST